MISGTLAVLYFHMRKNVILRNKSDLIHLEKGYEVVTISIF